VANQRINSHGFSQRGKIAHFQISPGRLKLSLWASQINSLPGRGLGVCDWSQSGALCRITVSSPAIQRVGALASQPELCGDERLASDGKSLAVRDQCSQSLTRWRRLFGADSLTC